MLHHHFQPAVLTEIAMMATYVLPLTSVSLTAGALHVSCIDMLFESLPSRYILAVVSCTLSFSSPRGQGLIPADFAGRLTLEMTQQVSWNSLDPMVLEPMGTLEVSERLSLLHLCQAPWKSHLCFLPCSCFPECPLNVPCSLLKLLTLPCSGRRQPKDNGYLEQISATEHDSELS